MRRPWLRSLILGLLVGPAPPPVAAEPIAFDTSEPVDCEAPEDRRVGGRSFASAEFLVWDEDVREARAWAQELAGLGLAAHESSGWSDVARRTAAHASILDDEIEEEIAAWSRGSDGDDAIGPLGCVLCLLPSLDRTYLVSAWATSPDPRLRRDLARALAAPFEATGVRSAIDHLCDDTNVEVRTLARVAAATRLRETA
jgi:hypothetical protein